MKRKDQVYADEIMQLVDKIAAICDKASIPMLMAFCIGLEPKDDGKMEMTIAGCVNLPKIVSPDPMILAANVLQVPGYDLPQNATVH